MKNYLAISACLLTSMWMLSACDKSDNTDTPPFIKETLPDGLAVLNEGNYAYKINGSLDYLDYQDDNMLRNVFSSVNGRSLGGTPNSAVLSSNGEIFTATTDENRIEIMDAFTMKSTGHIDIRCPRKLTIMEGFVYVSSYTGKVYKIKDDTHSLVDSSEVVGANLEGIAVAKGHVYVCNSTNADYSYNSNVVMLDTELNKLKDINVVTNPTQLVSDGSRVYLVSQGNYYDIKAEVQQIDTKTDAVANIGTATMIALGPNGLYMINAPWGAVPIYSYLDFGTGMTRKFIEGTEIFNPYSIGVDPLTSDVYISSLSEDPETHYSSYSMDGYLTRYKADGTFVKQYPCGVNPGTILFISHVAIFQE